MPAIILDPLDREQCIGLPALALVRAREFGGGGELLAGPQTRAP
jgi:hypothetical protein